MRPSAPAGGTVTSRAVSGFGALALRQVVGHGAAWVGTVFLSWWLAPAEFGAIALLSTLVTFIATATDLGCGAALVQRPEPPTQTEVRAFATLQLTLAAAVSAAGFAAAPSIARAYGLGEGSVVAAAVALAALSTLRGVPAVLLERDLAFGPIAIVEAAGLVAYHAALAGGVGHGLGVWSVPLGAALRSTVEVCGLSLARPWPAAPTLDVRPALRVLGYGLRLQTIRLAALAKDSLAILILAPLLGGAAVGYLQWSILYVGIPVIFLSLVTRVTFPAFSRLQAEPAALRRLVELTLRFTLGLGLPALGLFVFWAEALIPIVYGPAWLAALPTVDALTLNMVVGLVVGTAFTVFYSLGQMGTAQRHFAAWVVLTYLVAWLSARLGLGSVGIGWAYSAATAVVGASAVRRMHALVPFSAGAAVRAPLLTSAPLVAIGLLVRTGWVPPWPALACALVVTGIAMVLAYGEEMQAQWSRRQRAAAPAGAP